MNSAVVITLSQPIDVIDQKVSSVTLNPPTGRHLMKAGSVFRQVENAATGETSIDINPDALGKLIGACGNLPMRSVEMMSAGDFMACTIALLPFLAPTPQSLTTISTAPVSGAT